MKSFVLAALIATAAVATPAQANSGGGSKGSEDYVSVAPMVVPVLDDYRMLGTLEVTVAVHVDDAATKEQYAERRPVVTDVFMRHLTEFARIWVDPARPVDVPRLAAAMEAAAKEFAPKSHPKVYVLEAVVRRR